MSSIRNLLSKESLENKKNQIELRDNKARFHDIYHILYLIYNIWQNHGLGTF